MMPRKKTKPDEEQKSAPNEQDQQPLQTVEEMQKQLEELQNQKDGILAKLQRLAADYDNYQKRSIRRIAEETAREKERIIKAMLPVLDNFEHAMANSRQAENVEAVLKGVHIVYDQMLDVLKAQGAEQIKAAGEKFDPAMHEAIARHCDIDKEDGIILEELQKGYKLNGRVIRASRVVVNKTPENQTYEEPETTDTQQ